MDKGKVLEYILKKLDENNYNVQYFHMSPHNYGIPQQRERVYFICVRKDLYKREMTDDDLIYKQNTVYNFNDFLDNKDTIDKKYFLDGDLLDCLEAWDEMIREFDIGEKISPTIMANEFHKYDDYSDEDFSKMAKWRYEYITKNRPLYEKYQDLWDMWYSNYTDILQKREIYGKLEWQVGPIKPNDSIFNYFIQMRQSGIRVKRAEYFPTLVAISQIPIYGKEKRHITPRECLRLQSFPDEFKLLEDDRHSYKQLGNSVNVMNVKNIIESTLTLYDYL